MKRGRTGIAMFFGTALVCLLLCGIVGGEFPELLSLTDNATNDFTVRKTNSAVSLAPRVARRHDRVSDVEPYIAAHDLLLSRFDAFEKSVLIPSEVFVLHTVLRT